MLHHWHWDELSIALVAVKIADLYVEHYPTVHWQRISNPIKRRDTKPSLLAMFMGPSWGRQDPGVPHVGPMDLAIWDVYFHFPYWVVTWGRTVQAPSLPYIENSS